MTIVLDYLRELSRAALDGWNRFWFAPTDPATLGLVRILGGAMLFYTHLIWALNSDAFFGPDAWTNALTRDRGGAFSASAQAWSYFWRVESPAVLTALHISALLVFAMLTLGLATRVVSVLAFLATVSYANRVSGAWFGLDSINGLVSMYLMIGPAGAAFSLDRLIARGRAGEGGAATVVASVSANLAIRLIQVHMCVVYLFAGMAKLQGDSWWQGDALWGGVANFEYQSIDATGLANYPAIVNLLTFGTVWWEVFYCVLVWPRLLRPITIAVAVLLHLGIAVFMGMMTFGLAMIFANMAFVSPALVRAAMARRADRIPVPAGQGRGAPATSHAANSKSQPMRLKGT